jgi:hypothetical protein
MLRIICKGTIAVYHFDNYHERNYKNSKKDDEAKVISFYQRH